jgi:hypothetical protein
MSLCSNQKDVFQILVCENQYEKKYAKTLRIYPKYLSEKQLISVYAGHKTSGRCLKK